MNTLNLPISPEDFILQIANPALEILGKPMASDAARVILTAICLQESGLKHRWQVVDTSRPEAKGPARGLAQFERGSREGRGGVWGVYLHFLSNEPLRLLCRARDVSFEPLSIWSQLEHDDILAIGVARLLLWTDAHALPSIQDSDGAAEAYLRCWRPGKPRMGNWAANHARAVRALEAVTA